MENRSRVPLAEAMPNRKVTPTRVTNMELEKPPTMAFTGTPPAMPSRNAAPMEKKPMLIFFEKPMATTRASTSSRDRLPMIKAPPMI